MGRLRLGFVTALTLTLAGRAGAAEITRVATRGEPGNPFQLHVTLRWDRFQERAQITREGPAAPSPGDPAGGIEGDELRYERMVNTVVPRVAFGLTSDLEVHFEWPYVLGDDRSWRYGDSASHPSTIDANTVNANGTLCQ